MKALNSAFLLGAATVLVFSVGCVIDDTGRPRGQSNAPSASIPDTGNPARRESASETLDKADPAAATPPAEVDVKVEKQ